METEGRRTSGGQRRAAARSDQRAVVLQGRRRAMRLSDSSYLVQWQTNTALWCVVNMAGLDEHAARCSAFRWHRTCEHLSLIQELCAREAIAGRDAGAR